MKKILFISTILVTTSLFSDSVIISDERPTFQKRHTFNKNVEEKKVQRKSSNRKSSKRKFKQDHHRYDKRYRSFDYDRNGYYNDEGYYYGYYDNTGYFYNNIFFQFNTQYSYNDRVYLRGYFRPRHQHRRVYRHHTINSWNRVHCYREPNVMVNGYYYDSPSYSRNSYNNSHRTHYYERDRGRVSHGRFSDHDERRGYHQAENRRDNFRRDNHQGENYRRENDRRESYRDNAHRRDRGHISRGRFSDKSKNRNRTRRDSSSYKNRGHLRISK